jgi:hypothetical protein
VLLYAIDGARSSGELAVDARQTLAGSVWSVVHGTATLEIGGELRHAGIPTGAEDLAALTVAALVAPSAPVGAAPR